MIILAVVITSLVAIAAFACGTGHRSSLSVKEFTKETLLPTNLRQFLLPPCPLCWAVRAGVIITAFLIVNEGLLA